MIIKSYDLKNNINKNINFYLFYGANTGLIEESINKIIKINFSKNVINYEQEDILSNINEFQESILNKSFFDDSKLIIINRVNDKLLDAINDILNKDIDDLKIILKSGILEKKSKLRKFFETSKQTIIVPFYEDNNQTLFTLAQNFFKVKNISISPQNINFIIERTNGNRINLNNELEKIANYSLGKPSIKLDEILKITNTSEDYNISELADQCLAKNKKKTLTMLNNYKFSSEDNILIIKTFLYKLKRLKKLQIDFKIKKNLDDIISSYKPIIFWKDRETVKQQFRNWDVNQLSFLIKEINYIELFVKKNSQFSGQILTNFILEKINFSNN